MRFHCIPPQSLEPMPPILQSSAPVRRSLRILASGHTGDPVLGPALTGALLLRQDRPTGSPTSSSDSTTQDHEPDPRPGCLAHARAFPPAHLGVAFLHTDGIGLDTDQRALPLVGRIVQFLWGTGTQNDGPDHGRCTASREPAPRPAQLQCLMDPDAGERERESADIIGYLYRRYRGRPALTQPPSSLDVFSAALAAPSEHIQLLH